MLTESARREIIIALDAGRKRLGRYPDRPFKWNPYTVINPASGINLTFSMAASWELIREKLEEGIEVKEIILEHPPGAKAYTFTVMLNGNPRELYVKFEFISGVVIGRSFHL